jgi:cytochrome c oxidase assembly protein subunit 15
MAEQANEPMAWATPLHRLVASILGLLILFLAFAALRRKKQRFMAFTLLGLTVFLAVLGINSGSLHNPGIVMGNLAGGFGMLALLGWMVFTSGSKNRRDVQGGESAVRRATMVAVIVLSLQIVLGGLTSANFAATSCRTLPDCHGSWLPGPALITAFDLSRQHEITAMGQAIGGEERLAIHKAHRVGGLITLAIVLLAALTALHAGKPYRATAVVILVLVTLEFLVGIAAILARLPISLAVAHNWLAGLILLALLRQAALSRVFHKGGRRNEGP